MKFPSPTIIFLLLLTFICIHRGQALDIALGGIECDESLPVYASPYNVQITCNDGETDRCSFGQDVMITGTCKLQP